MYCGTHLRQCVYALFYIFTIQLHRRASRPAHDSILFLALPLATLRSEHVRITVFISTLAARYQSLAIKSSRLFGMSFCIWLLFLAIPWVEFAIDRNIKTEVGRLLLYPWMLVIPVSITLTMGAFILQRPSSRANPIKPSKHLS